MSDLHKTVIDDKAQPEYSHVEAVADPNSQWADHDEAIAAEAYQRNLGVWASFKMYKKAVFWSFVASSTLIIEGYDTMLLGSFYTLPAFQKKYGDYYPAHDGGIWSVPANWQMAFTVVTSVGSLVGVLLGAWQVERWGYRWTLIFHLTVLNAFIAMVTFSPNRIVLIVGQACCSIPWGVFSTLSTAFASEVLPISLRGFLTTYVNLSWVIGQLICQGVLNGYAVVHLDETNGYRVPWCIQFMWPVPIIVGIFFSPESPWWLVRRGRLEEAAESVRRLTSQPDATYIHNNVAMMVRTNNLERELAENSGSFASCFKGTDLRRTEISTMAYGCQVFSGITLGISGVYFFVQAGLGTSDAFKLVLGMMAMGFCGTCASWVLISYFGRRSIFLTGMVGMTTALLVVGILACVSDKHPGALWGIAAMLFVWMAFYQSTVGPLAFTLIGEMSSTRVRNKTIGLSRGMYNVAALVFGILNPYMINNTAWGWAGKAGFFYGGIALIATVWVYFRLPETRGRSYRELDVLFERRVPARKFSSTTVSDDADEEILRAHEGAEKQ